MDEGKELNPQAELTAEKYLELIGPTNKNNVVNIRDAIMDSVHEDSLQCFILAVGGTVEKENPAQRKDIDIKVGINTASLEGQAQLAPIGQYRKQFEDWKSFMLKAVQKINQNQDYVLEVEPPLPDIEHPSLPQTEGTIRLTPNNGGAPIELLCYQKTPIPAPFVTLYSDTEMSKIA